jgi:T4 RnlA family RNA ligase
MARSKMSLISDQAVAATNLYNTNNDIKKLVDNALNNDVALFFEYVSRENKIVLDYSKEDLILLRARDNNTGDYIDVRDFDTNVSVANFHDYTLDEVIELAKTAENTEGWVIETENNLMKIKTDWYFHRHKLFTEQLNRANDVVKLILDEEIDDVLAQLSDSEADMAKRDWIEDVEKAVSNYISLANTNIDNLVNDYKGDKKEFALTYRKDKWFSMAMNVINGKDKYEGIKQRIFKDTYHLKSAENWIKVYG